MLLRKVEKFLRRHRMAATTFGRLAARESPKDDSGPQIRQLHPSGPARPDDTTLPTAHPERERRRDRHDGFDARHVEHRVRVDGAMCMWLTSTPRTRSIARESLFEGSFHGGSGYVGHSSRVLVR